MADVNIPVHAVVFDLWHTLIPFPAEVRGATFDRMAEVLGIGPEELRPRWAASRAERETTDLSGFLTRLGPSVGMVWSSSTIEAAVAARKASHGVCFADAFDDGRAAIAALRERGIVTGLVSNCTSEVRQSLVDHGMDRWFDTIILSAEVGVMKPSPAIYLLATSHLGVEPAQCLYVGDGGDDELVGAMEVGMTPVRYAPAGGESWTDMPTVASHLELLTMIGP